MRKNRNLLAIRQKIGRKKAYNLGTLIFREMCQFRNELKNDKGIFYIDKKTKVRSLEKPKGKSRTIVYLKDSNTRIRLLSIAKILEKLATDEMHGFIPNKGIHTFWQQIQDAKSMNKIDLRNAFEQISDKWVYRFFRSLYLNKQDALRLTELTTYKGHLYQGSPISPMLFNIYCMGALEDIKGLGLKVQAYADDIIVYSEEFNYISWRIIKVVNRILTQYGLKVNKNKCHFVSNLESKQNTYLGLHLKEPRIKKASKYRKRMRQMNYIAEKGANNWHGKSILACYVGTKNWTNYNPKVILAQ